MSKYSQSDWERITSVSCVETALALGMEFDEKRSDIKALRVKESGGLFIWRDGSGWYRHTTEERGFSMDLVMKEKNLTYREALDFINLNVLGGVCKEVLTARQYSKPAKPVEEKPFTLPHRTEPKRIYWYLINKRGIDKEIVAKLIQSGSVFQEKDRGNCCFVGFDKSNTPRHCAKRGTSEMQFRGEINGSQKQYGFCMRGTGKVLQVFESPIDAMSHASLAKMVGGDWRKDTRLSLGGITDKALEKHLSDNPGRYDEIWLCLDNDREGQTAAVKLLEQFSDRYNVSIKRPSAKDWNEDLQHIHTLCEDLGCDKRRAVQMVYHGERASREPPQEVAEEAEL